MVSLMSVPLQLQEKLSGEVLQLLNILQSSTSQIAGLAYTYQTCKPVWSVAQSHDLTQRKKEQNNKNKTLAY